jgi:AcrR family transcriptional regulator
VVNGGRQRILEAALELFDRHGYGATSLSEVRRAAGVSNGSLYHHFAGREQLAATLLLDGLTRYQHGFRALLERSDAEQVIRGGVSYHLRFGVRHRALARFLLAPVEPEVLAATDGALAGQNRAFLREVHDWFDQEAGAGKLLAVEPALRYPLWLGASQETARAWLTDQAPSPSRYAEQLADAAWRALGP